MKKKLPVVQKYQNNLRFNQLLPITNCNIVPVLNFITFIYDVNNIHFETDLQSCTYLSTDNVIICLYMQKGNLYLSTVLLKGSIKLYLK